MSSTAMPAYPDLPHCVSPVCGCSGGAHTVAAEMSGAWPVGTPGSGEDLVRAESDLTGDGWGLILTGGANWGAIQVGVVKALFERGFSPEVIVGVSVGAINGAYLSCIPSLRGVAGLLELWREVDARQILGTRAGRLRELGALVFRRSAMFPNRALRSFLEVSLPVDRFEETVIPLVTVASDLTSGTPRLFSEGDLLEAVLASAAIPGLFPPVEIGGERLVDGAIADPLPLAPLRERGIRRVVVAEAGRPCGCDDQPGDPLGAMRQAVTVVTNHRLNLLIRDASHSHEVVDLGSVCHPDTPITDFSDAELKARLGYQDAVRRIEARRSPLSVSSGFERRRSLSRFTA